MDVVTTHIVTKQEVGQFFGHSLGQSSDQHAFFHFDALLDFFHQVINLIQTRADLYNRIEQTRRSDYLIDYNAFALHQLVLGRSGTDINHLLGQFLKLLKLQRTVIKCRFHAETILNQVGLSGTVASIHGMDLRHTHMAFINYNQEIIRKKIKQTIGAGTCRTPVKIAGVILNTRTMPKFANHLHIISHPFIKSFGLVWLTFFFKTGYLLGQIVFDLMDSTKLAFLRSHEQVSGIDFIFIKLTQTNA